MSIETDTEQKNLNRNNNKKRAVKGSPNANEVIWNEKTTILFYAFMCQI